MKDDHKHIVHLNFLVEGQTEETFVRKVLEPHLWKYGIYAYARCVETGHNRAQIFRGGMTTYEKAKRDLLNWIGQKVSSDFYFTCMFDLYKLPNSFPDYEKAKKAKDISEQVRILEDAFRLDIAHPLNNFIPYFQTHEFEAILFADPDVVLRSVKNIRVTKELIKSVSKFKSPEEINGNNPPSKRIKHVCKSYDKVSDGPIWANQIGLETIRQKCGHFNDWINKLENLAKKTLQ